jgi:hypothetical protein
VPIVTAWPKATRSAISPRGVAVGDVDLIGVGAGFEQHLDHRGVGVPDRQIQRRHAVNIR